jgi:hypothetical protein
MTIHHPEFSKHNTAQSVQTARDATMLKAENDKSGTACPCCGQWCKLYRRTLNASMARFLIWLVRSYQDNPRWVTIKEFPLMSNRRGGNDYSKLAHWKLIEQKANTDDPTKRTSGEWRPTPKGIEFAHQRISVPNAVFLYDGICQGFSDKSTDIVAALGKEFNYQELMSA